MEPATYVEHVRRDGAALGAAARRDLAAAVPNCPGWDLAALVSHVGTVHRWAAGTVGAGPGERIRLSQIPAAPGDHDGLLAWYDEGLASLLGALGAADPDAETWTFTPTGDRRARFWFRRQAQETAVHRWDAQAALGVAEPLDAALAVDGVDEFFEVMAARRLAADPVPDLDASLHLHATDVEGEWFVALHPDRLEQRHEHAKADAAVRGPASELLLWLWNRRPDDAPDLQVFGDTAVLARIGSLAP